MAPHFSIETIKSNEPCVYLISADNVYVYIGHGTIIEAFARLSAVMKNEMIADNSKIAMDFKNEGKPINDCFQLAMKLQSKHNPMLNQSLRNDGRQRGPVRCLDDGQMYSSAARAAETYGYASSTMANHLNGKIGYEQIGGREFERVTVQEYQIWLSKNRPRPSRLKQSANRE